MAGEINPLTSLGDSIQALVKQTIDETQGTNQTQTTPTQQPQTVETQPTPGTADLTQISQTNKDTVKTTNMQTGEYKSPYQAEQDALLGELQNAEIPQYTDQTKNYINSVFNLNQQPKTYDAENDPLVKLAREQVQKSVMDMANKRGFAYGSYESDIVRQQMDKLSGQFEQIAYDQNADFLNRQIGLANTMMKWEKMQFDRKKNAIELLRTKLDFFNTLDNREFQIFKVMLDQRNMQRQLGLKEKRIEFQVKQQNIENALTRLDNLGYVDNESSIVLGFPVGTKAKWVQEAAMKQQQALDKMAKENEYNIAKQNLDFQMEKELAGLKNRLDEQSKMKYLSMEYNYKKELLAIEQSYNEQKYKIAAAKAAAARSSSGGGRSSSGGSSSSKSKSGSTQVSDAKLSSRYTTEAKRFIAKFGNKKSYKQDAAEYLDNLRRAGVEPEVLLRLRAEFNIPNLASKTKTIYGVNWATGELIIK